MRKRIPHHFYREIYGVSARPQTLLDKLVPADERLRILDEIMQWDIRCRAFEKNEQADNPRLR